MPGTAKEALFKSIYYFHRTLSLMVKILISLKERGVGDRENKVYLLSELG